MIYYLMILLPLAAVLISLKLGGIWKQLYLIGARLLLGALMLMGGLYKLSDNHIPGLMGPPMDHAMLAKYGLVLFAEFIGVAQLLMGLLLLTRRFALLGAVLLVPMWLNIIFLTLSQNWTGTPWLTSGFLILTIGLLLHDYHRLRWIIYPPQDPAALQALPAKTGGYQLETLWWLGVLTVVGGSLLYSISLPTMLATMGLGVAMLLGGLIWEWRLRA